jgi:hypothetical protein
MNRLLAHLERYPQSVVLAGTVVVVCLLVACCFQSEVKSALTREHDLAGTDYLTAVAGGKRLTLAQQ